MTSSYTEFAEEERTPRAQREIETGRREDGCRPGIAEGRTRAGTAGELKETVKLAKRWQGYRTPKSARYIVPLRRGPICISTR
jgi:hypothetical protein